ncbi:soluble calcium-activated nucleotidase 1-like [Asterias amurensis]|uniref:soluble calcium-activated nucleotidase 1-like n=1 Tax=Asterias amurensis TaxID=7602 RepID=UPI003AB24F8B
MSNVGWIAKSTDTARSPSSNLLTSVSSRGNRTSSPWPCVGVLRGKPKVVIGVVMFLILVLVFLLLPSSKHGSASGLLITEDIDGTFAMSSAAYNRTYPITNPERTLDGKRFRIGLISDLDQSSKSTTKDNTWIGYFLKGYLTINNYYDHVSITLDSEPAVLKSQLSQGGRGMELSELVTFNGKLYSVDDRTGVVYEVIGDTVVPWLILSDGNGKITKGFKGEWMAVKDQKLFVGGLGKEWTTTDGELVNLNPQWVKLISFQGGVAHLSWVKKYNAMRDAAGVPWPGYMIHESGVWSDIHKRWFFLPRRASKERYTEADDEHRATNLLITCDDNFKEVHVNKIGVLNNIRGYSSFKFIPGTKDTVIVALKTEEDRGSIATYITAFDIYGKILVADRKFADLKYEGIEFI